MFRQIHSILALTASVLIILMALTGAILSVNPVLERAAATIPASGQVTVAELASKVQAQYPGVEKIVRKASGDILVSYTDGDNSGTDRVDPLSGTRIEASTPSPWTRFFTNLHRSFMLDDVGRAIAGCCAFLMIVLSVTGFILFAKRLGGMRAVFSPIRGGGLPRIHSEIGRVALVFLLITALTGTYMSLVTFSILSDGMDAQPAIASQINGGQPMALAAMPALQSVDLSSFRELTFPMAGDLNDVFTLTTSQGVGLVDQATGLQVSYLANGLARQIYEFVFMLHTGQGVWWLSLCLGLAALSVPVMAISGALIAYKRWSSMPHFKHNGRAASADTIILVGSEGSTTWGFARTLHDALVAAGHHVHTGPMNSLAANYAHAKQMFVLTSTYGDGAAPQSANQFLTKLQAQSHVPDFKVAVLGFGDKQFSQFCQFAKDVETALVAKGWKLGMASGTVDRQSAQDFQRWGEDAGHMIGAKLTLVHQATLPRSTPLELVERDDYGQEFQSPASVMRFALPKTSLWQRLFGGRMLSV